MHPLTVFLDFDGTITMRDIGAILLQKYTGDSWIEMENKVKSGTLTMREGLSGQWSLVTTPLEQLREDAMQEVEIRSGFVGFISWLVEAGIPTHVLSDGLDLYVPAAIAGALDGAIDNWREKVSIDCNKTGFDGHVTLEFQPECDHGCALCKIARVQEKRHHAETIVYIGDGVSDWKASPFADIVFAVRGSSLASNLQKSGTENSAVLIEFETFSEIQENEIWARFKAE